MLDTGDERCEEPHTGIDHLGRKAGHIGDHLSQSVAHGTHSSREAPFIERRRNIPHHAGGKLHSLTERPLHTFIGCNAKTLQTGLEDGEVTLEVVELGVCHVLHGAAAVGDRVRQVVELITAASQERLGRFKVYLVENLIEDLGFLALAHVLHGGVEVLENFIEGPHIARSVIDLQPQGLHGGGCFVRGSGQRKNDISEGRAALGSLDAAVGQNTQSGVELGGAARQALGRAAHRQNGLTKLGHAGVGLAGRLGHLIAKPGEVFVGGLNAQRRHGIGRQVGCIGQVHAAGRCQVQDGGQSVRRRLGIVTGQGQIV